MISTETTTVDTGLPLVRLNMDGTRSVTALVAFDAGARTERPEENGMAHFLEHLVFKGGEKYASYRDVNETAERLGAQLNAYTSHDVSPSTSPAARRRSCRRSTYSRTSWPRPASTATSSTASGAS